MSSKSNQRAIDPILFNWPAPSPALLASRCTDCAAITFPVKQSCASCGGTAVDVQELPRRGKLWSWTIQRFMPKSPYQSDETSETFTPYGVGYVELPGALRVEARLTVNDPELLQIGAEMELVFYTHRTDSDGTEVINYAFRPV